MGVEVYFNFGKWRSVLKRKHTNFFLSVWVNRGVGTFVQNLIRTSSFVMNIFLGARNPVERIPSSERFI